MSKLLTVLGCDVAMATAFIQKMKLDKGAFLYPYLITLGGEPCEQNRKDKVTRFPSVTYVRDG